MLKYVFAVIFIALAWAAVFVFEELPIELAVWTTAGVITLLVLYVVGKWLLAKAAAAKIESALASAGGDDDGLRPEVRAQIQEMNAEFQKAVRTLKSSKVGKVGSSALAALPWYVIIGPPGSGKSTLLRNSGLKFPYLNAKRGAVRGVGGTRNCDWWMANEGILLDTAGRWSTEEDDQDEWLAFLDLLKRTRKGRPLNGILLGISAGELLETAQDEVPALAKKLRERIDEVMKRLEVTLPVYLIITKCDLIGGFVETFGPLGEKERGMIWGLTLPLEASSPAPEMFVERLDRLVDTIETRALTRLKAEHRPEIKRRLYEFPQQFEELCPALVDLVNDLFSENAYQDSPILRGVYFTSGTQEGRPIDRVVQRMAQAIGLAPAADYQPVLKAKSYFLRDVFKQVIFPDQNVAGEGEKAVRRRRLIGYAGAGAAFLLALGIAFTPVSAYTANLSFARAIREWGEALMFNREPNGGMQRPTAELDNLYEISQRLLRFEVEGPDAGMRFGFYQGDKLEPVMGRVARDQVVRPLLHRDVEVMNLFANRKGKTFDEALAALRAHLLLTGPKEPNEPRPVRGGNWDKAVPEGREGAVERWKRLLLDKGAQTAPRSEKVIGDAVEIYMRQAAEVPELWEPRNAEAVKKVRDALCTAVNKSPLEQIKSIDEFEARAVTLGGLVGGSITLFKDAPRVHGAFTREGWPLVKNRLEAKGGGIEDEREWALGGCEALPEGEIKKLRRDYVAEYEKEWRAFFAKVQPKEESDFTAAEQHLRRYSDDRPLAQIWAALAANVPIVPPQAPGAVDKITTKAQTRLGQLIGGSNANRARNMLPHVEEANALALVQQHLQPLLDFGVPNKPGTPTSLDLYYDQLRTVVNALKTYADDHQIKPLMAVVKRAARDVEDIITRSPARTAGFEQELRQMLLLPISALERKTTIVSHTDANDQWCDGVAIQFQQTLAEFYPFRNEGPDAPMVAVEQFFHPQNGALWKYYQAALAGDLDAQTFQVKRTAGVPYNDRLSAYLKRARAATELLFPRGSPQVNVPVEARIWPGGTGVAQIIFRVGNNRIMHRNEGERFQPLTWPARDAEIAVHAVHGTFPVDGRGDWGLFRLIDKADRVDPVRDEREVYLRAQWAAVGPSGLTVDFKPANLRSALRGLNPPTVVAPGSSKCSGR